MKVLQNPNLIDSCIKRHIKKIYIKGLKVENKKCDKPNNSSCSSDIAEITRVI